MTTIDSVQFERPESAMRIRTTKAFSIASHAEVFSGVVLEGGNTAPLKTLAWEAIVAMVFRVFRV